MDRPICCCCMFQKQQFYSKCNRTVHCLPSPTSQNCLHYSLLMWNGLLLEWLRIMLHRITVYYFRVLHMCFLLSERSNRTFRILWVKLLSENTSLSVLALSLSHPFRSLCFPAFLTLVSAWLQHDHCSFPTLSSHTEPTAHSPLHFQSQCVGAHKRSLSLAKASPNTTEDYCWFIGILSFVFQ